MKVCRALCRGSECVFACSALCCLSLILSSKRLSQSEFEPILECDNEPVLSLHALSLTHAHTLSLHALSDTLLSLLGPDARVYPEFSPPWQIDQQHCVSCSIHFTLHCP